MFGDELTEQVLAFGIVEVDDVDAAFAEPVNAALECFGFADYDCADTELTDETAAIPARGERRSHYRVAIASLPAGLAKGISLTVDRGVILLYAAIVPAAEEIPFPVEECRSDRNTALGCARGGPLQ